MEGLIARCLAGEDAARAEFINRHAEHVRRAVERKLASLSARPPVRQDVEDIANDVLVRLLENNCAALASVRDHRSITAWLTVVAGNYTVDYVRKWSHRVRVHTAAAAQEEPEAYGPGPDTALARDEAIQRLAALLVALPDRDRIILELYYIHGETYAEIAAITGRNINTVATQIRRAKERLRELLPADATAEGLGHAIRP